ncbi:hypothetical protein, conserved [Plasmodium gonderi]|uniref:Uncharacterized protein n=1 Tax=Plasmodium gonderi TaxID=77519 RepID=A0A1Y1JTR4_PLAGO|nr:hypothetical protein, conserved [Plasmodium gonderi]GAW83294.1 hypothetical protein, conserved [Plasmodium gonderi]
MEKIRNRKFPFAHLNKRLYISSAEEIVKTTSCRNKKNKFKNIYMDFSLNKYLNINSLNVNKFIKTPIHYQTFKELVDTIKSVSNVRLQNIHLIRKIVNSLEMYLTNYLNNLSNIQNLNHLTGINVYNDMHYYEDNFSNLDDNDEDENSITANNVVTVLVSLYKLKYRNEKFLQLLEKYIFVNKEKFKFSQINLILYIYSYFNIVNKKFINCLLVTILDNKNMLNADNILNIFTSLFYLNCKNEKTLDRLANYIISNNLHFDINVIIFLLNNLKKLNYSNTCLVEYFHEQIVLKLGFLSPQAAQSKNNSVDPFFLKRKIQNILDEENSESGNIQSILCKNDVIDSAPSNCVFLHLKDDKNEEIISKESSRNYDKEKNYNMCEEDINNTYGSIHNKYIVENNYVDYIYEYYNKKDFEDRNKSKINILMEVLIYYKYFKEDLLKVLYEYLMNNLKTYISQNDNNMCCILSKMYSFEINNFPNIIMLNKKMLLSMCYYYVPIYKNTNIMIFLYLKLLLEKHNYFNIFIDNIIIKKIQTDFLNLNQDQFLNQLNECKHSYVIKYLCDISLVYFNFFNVKCFSHHSIKEDIKLHISENFAHHLASSSPPSSVPALNTTHMVEDKNVEITFEFNEKNELYTYDRKFLLQLFYFYVEVKYYKGIFLFLKSLFSGIKNFKEFDPYVYYKINNYFYDDRMANHGLDVQKSNIYIKLNALEVIQIYEYFKNAFESYEDFLSIQRDLINANHEKTLYYQFYVRRKGDTNDCKMGVTTIIPPSAQATKKVKHSIQDANENQNGLVSKYLFTQSSVNYISRNCFGAKEKCELNPKLGNFFDKGKQKENIPLEKKKWNDELIGSEGRNGHTGENEKICFEKSIFHIDTYIYNVLNNTFLYTPVDLFALHIHHFNSQNIFFLLQNIIFKLNYLNINYLSLVISKIFSRMCKETCRETKKRYFVFLDFFHDYLLGDESGSQTFSYQKKSTEGIKSFTYLEWNEKRLVISRIYEKCITKYKDQDKVKKRIAYILCKNKGYSKYINNDIIFDEEFLNFFFQLVLEKKTLFQCSYYKMTNECLFFILKSLQMGKKNAKYMQSVNIITNIFMFRYIHYKHRDQLSSEELSKKCTSENLQFLDPYIIDIVNAERELCLNLNLSLNRMNKKDTSNNQIPQNASRMDNNVWDRRFEYQYNTHITDKSARENITQKGATTFDRSSTIGSNINEEYEMMKKRNTLKRFIKIYYTIVKVRYFHEMPINKHIFRELCLNTDYIDNSIFLNLLFFIHKYKFEEMKYILMLQKKCLLYKDLYYTHSNCRVVEFLCKKLKINLEENVRTTPTKQTSYDYENV